MERRSGRAPKPGSDEARAASPEEAALENRIIRGDRQALAELFSLYRPRLWRMVNFRLHPQLQGRVDPDDVLQDAWLNALDRVGYFLRDASHSSFIWFRMIVDQTLVELQRRHLGAQKRSASRESSLDARWGSDSTSASLAFHLSGSLTSPSSALGRVELAKQLDVALQGLSDTDREVLALRHFEELSNAETARVLGMSEQAASARYIRALARLKQIVEAIPSLGGRI